MAPPTINKNGPSGKPAEPGFAGFGGRAGVFGPYYPITHPPLHINGGGGTAPQPKGPSNGGQLEKLAEIVDGVGGGAKKDGMEPGPEPLPAAGQHQPDALGQHGGAKGSPADGAAPAAGGADYPMPVKRKYNRRAKLWDGSTAKQQRKRKADEQVIVIDDDEPKKGGKPATKLAAPPLAPSALPTPIAVASAQKKPRLLEKSAPKTNQDLPPPPRAVLAELNKVTEAAKEQEVPKAENKLLFDMMKKDIQNFYWKMSIPQVIVFSPDEAWPRRIATQNWVGTMMHQLLQPPVMCNSCRVENVKWSQDRFLLDNNGFLHFSQKFCPLCVWTNMHCADGILQMREEERKASYRRFQTICKAKKAGESK